MKYVFKLKSKNDFHNLFTGLKLIFSQSKDLFEIHYYGKILHSKLNLHKSRLGISFEETNPYWLLKLAFEGFLTNPNSKTLKELEIEFSYLSSVKYPTRMLFYKLVRNICF